MAEHMAERLSLKTVVETVQDYPELDAMARKAGLFGIELLGLPKRTSNSLTEQIPGTLVQPGSLVQVRMFLDQLHGRPFGVGRPMVAEVNRRLVALTTLSKEQVEAKISGILRQRKDEEERKQQHKPGETLLTAAQTIGLIGGGLPDGLSLHTLKYGSGADPDWDKAAWTEVINSLPPVQKAVVRAALSRALRQSFRTVGAIRRASPKDLLRAGGYNSREFFHRAFGSNLNP